mmetsp:Transcript_13796/g.20552  ORF Transcript_13796/g.20552 Transcript_13796/m.20552 type:complete len:83 (-) Transcript_13796:212-460(-)
MLITISAVSVGIIVLICIYCHRYDAHVVAVALVAARVAAENRKIGRGNEAAATFWTMEQTRMALMEDGPRMELQLKLGMLAS